jgi:N-acetylneuraminic acid mutarotase
MRVLGITLLAVALSVVSPVHSDLDSNSYWFTRPPMPQARQEAPAATLDGYIYTASGIYSPGIASNRMDRYDPRDGTWQQMTSLNVPRHHASLTELNGKLYLMGRYDLYAGPWVPTPSLFEYDPSTGLWSEKAQAPIPTGEHVAAAYGGKLYVVGGKGSSGLDALFLEIYDPVTNSWSTGASPSQFRNHHQAVVVDTLIYVIGGRDDGLNNTNFMEAYSPASNTWHTKAPMPTPRGGLMAAAMHGRIYVFGGEQFFPTQGVRPEVEEYNPVTNTWRRLADAPHPRHGTAATTIGDTIFIFGGGFKAGLDITGLNEGFTLGICVDSDDDGYADASGGGNTCPVDNCPLIANADQSDTDNDGIGDVCDACPTDAQNDIDVDGFCADLDNCPVDFNPLQEDNDADGIGNACCCAGGTGNVDCDPGDGVDISDLSTLIDNLYISFSALCCPAEANCDGEPGIDIADLSALIDYLYISFTPPAGCF